MVFVAGAAVAGAAVAGAAVAGAAVAGAAVAGAAVAGAGAAVVATGVPQELSSKAKTRARLEATSTCFLYIFFSFLG